MTTKTGFPCLAISGARVLISSIKNLIPSHLTTDRDATSLSTAKRVLQQFDKLKIDKIGKMEI